MDFIIPFLKGFWKITASFLGTIDTNLFFRVNINWIYGLAILVVSFVAIRAIINYWDKTDKKRIVYRLFSAGIVALLFVGIAGYLIKETALQKIHINPIEGFIGKASLGEDQIEKKKLFYGINADELKELKFTSMEDELKLYYTLYNTNTSIKVRNNIEYVGCVVKLGGNDCQTFSGKVTVEDDGGGNKISVKINDNEISGLVKGKKLYFGFYKLNGDDLVKEILKRNDAGGLDTYIVKIGNNVFITPFFIYKMAFDEGLTKQIRDKFNIPFVFFLLDDKLKKYFVYNGTDYYTFTFTNKSILLYFFNNTQWDQKRAELLGEKPENQKEITDFMINNSGGIKILLLSFLFGIIIFFLSYGSLILYIFIPVYTIFIMEVVSSLDDL